jgi:hypothetical protein
MKKSLLLLWAISPLFSKQISVDKYLSPYTGADLFISSIETQMEVEDSLKEWASPEEETWLSQGVGGCYRLLSSCAWWAPMGILSGLGQHEIFGHGYRVREFRKYGYNLIGFDLKLEDKSSSIAAITAYTRNGDEIPFLDNLIASGGTEASTVMTQRLRELYFEKGHMDGRLHSLYFFGASDLVHYIQNYNKIEDKETATAEGNDIGNYLYTVNKLNPQNPVTISQLDKMSIVYLLDPYLWGSFVSFWSYVLLGKEYPTPVFQWSAVRFAPACSMNLTPFGPELIVEQYISFKTTPFKTYFRYTPYNKKGIYGAGYKNLFLKSYENFHLGCMFDAWYAPKLGNIANPDLEFDQKSPMRPGAQILVTIRGDFPVFNTFSFGCDVGVKTQGYLMGSFVEKGFVGRAVLELDF